ncbi:MAG: Biopolymer transport protein ExbD [Alphaproteobacteria bacterium ADurb.BinA280]|jgi:biopolymer transport protein ExbD|nr:biopolymer transporter ExbD [Xanthomonadales bacterium]MCC6504533.1 biopolymer transporter ExbD [Aquimonas sp.]OPZ12162.1 MAG: Biopolymer transport protein ExbD [Alphaproteobacteria bacterium ADurb.BinA280]
MKLGSSHATEEPELNLTSLIDVVFCLIIFFVVTTTFDDRSALNIVLPKAAPSETIPVGEPLQIQINAEGRYFIAGNEVLQRDIESLKTAITQVAGEDRERSVILRADGRTPHQAVVTAMDALGSLGFSKLSIATVSEESAPATGVPSD